MLTDEHELYASQFFAMALFNVSLLSLTMLPILSGVV
jgi:hypothetical protein